MLQQQLAECGMQCFLTYGIGTYLVLLGSWALACTPFEIIDR